MSQEQSTAAEQALARLCEDLQVGISYVFGSRAGEVRDWLVGDRLDLSPGPTDVNVGVKVAPGARHSFWERWDDSR